MMLYCITMGTFLQVVGVCRSNSWFEYILFELSDFSSLSFKMWVFSENMDGSKFVRWVKNR